MNLEVELSPKSYRNVRACEDQRTKNTRAQRSKTGIQVDILPKAERKPS